MKTLTSTLLFRILTMLSNGLLGVFVSKSVISEYGIAVYAAIFAIVAIPLLFPSLDLGLGAPIINSLTAKEFVKESEDPQRVVSAALKVLLTVSSFSAFVCYILISTDIFDKSFGPAIAELPQFKSVILLVLMFTFLSMPLTIGSRILQGIGRNDLSVAFTTFIPISGAVYYLFIRVSGIQIGYVSAYVAFGTLLSGLISIVVSFKMLGWKFYDVFSIRLKRNDFRFVISKSIYYFFIGLGLGLALQLDRVILSHQSDSLALAHYTAALQLYMPLWSLLISVAAGLWFNFRRLEVGERISIQGLHQIIKRYFLGGFLLGISFYFFSSVFASFVTNDKIELTSTLRLSLFFLMLVQSVQLPMGYFLSDYEGLKFQAKLVCAMVITNIPLSIYLADILGAAGPVLGSIISISIFQVLPSYWFSRKKILSDLD